MNSYFCPDCNLLVHSSRVESENVRDGSGNLIKQKHYHRVKGQVTSDSYVELIHEVKEQ